MLVGGGGAEEPLRNALIHVPALLLLAVLVAAHAGQVRALPSQGRVAFGLASGAILILFCLHFLPLPDGPWFDTDAQHLADTPRTLAGVADQSRTLSLDAEASQHALISLALSAAILIFCLSASGRELRLLARVALLGAVTSALIGMAQLGIGRWDWLMVGDQAENVGTGLFANPNHQAGLLAVALIFAGLEWRGSRQHVHRALVLVAAMLLMTGIIASGSRSGLVMALIALPTAIHLSGAKRQPRRLFAGLAIAAALLVGMIALYPAGAGLALRQQLLDGSDIRFALWPELVPLLKASWPWGSGIGSFAPLYAAFENLDLTGDRFINHAHNDLIEWLIETGLPGAVLLLGLAVGLVVTARRRLRGATGEDRALHIAGIATVGLLLLQSLVDYPLRIETMVAVAALGLGMILFRPDAPFVRHEGRLPGRSLAMGAIMLPLMAMIGFQALQMGLAQQAVRDGNGPAAYAFHPQNGAGAALAAQAALANNEILDAERLARTAIAETPLSPMALRVLALAAEAQGKPSGEFWRAAAALGWRDGPTQFWAFRQALAAGEMEVAAIRADAALRVGKRKDEMIVLGRNAANDAAFRAAWLERLATSPAWRPAFFALTNDSSDGELAGIAALYEAGLAPKSAEMAPFLDQLLRRGRGTEAANLFAKVDNGPALPVRDAGIEADTDSYKRGLTAFDWRIRPSNLGNGNVEYDGDNRFLSVSGTGVSRWEGLHRYFDLPPGDYRLSVDLRRIEGPSDGVALRLACGSDDLGFQTMELGDLPLGEWVQRSADMRIGTGCRPFRFGVQTLQRGEPVAIGIDNLAIERIGDANAPTQP